MLTRTSPAMRQRSMVAPQSLISRRHLLAYSRCEAHGKGC
jgi:hypothetical protein